MSKLRDQSKLAIGKLEELKASSDDSWEAMVTDMEKMSESFTNSFLSFFVVPKVSASPAAGYKAARTGKKAG